MPHSDRDTPEQSKTISPFAAIVDPGVVQAAAERAEKLDLPRRRSESWVVRDDDDEEDQYPMNEMTYRLRPRPGERQGAR